MADATIGYASGNKLASALGIDEKMVRKYEANGLFQREKSGPNAGLYDVERCRALRAANSDPDASIKGLAGGAAVSADPKTKSAPENNLTRARTAQAILGAQVKEIELKRLRGDLILVEDARRAARAVVTTVCERIDGAAAQIGARVVGCKTAAEAEKIAREILRAVRAEVAGIADSIDEVSHAS